MKQRKIFQNFVFALLGLFLLGGCSSDSGGGTMPIDPKIAVESGIQKGLADKRRELTDPAEIDIFNANVKTLITHLLSLVGDEGTLREEDVIATLTTGGGICFASRRSFPCDPERQITADTFDPAAFITELILVNRSAIFSDSLKVAYYRVDNPETGNEQLVAYDGVTKKQIVVKTNVILGSQTFIFEGEQNGDKQVITGKKYGIFLDPNVAQETRVASDGRGGFFQYTFFFDNGFKRFDIAAPSKETLIFNSSMLASSLKNQGVIKIGTSITLHNNPSDPNNSFVDLEAFTSLPDLFKGETGSGTSQAPIVVRLVDGNMTQGRLLRILKDSTTGLTDRVLINFEAVHIPGNAGSFDEHLKVCSPDLSACTDVTDGDGGFYVLAKNSSHIYLAKEGSDVLYAFEQSAETLMEVTGVKYPAVFDPDQHLIGAGGHGGGGILSDFSSIAGAKTYLADGSDAYLAVNYDLDRNTKVGSFMFLGPIHVQKHAQILKLTGTTGVKMFDNGDGIDHGDASSDGAAESAVGHANLIAVKNGKLFVEIANYDGISAGGTCTPSSFGYNCFSVHYGYLSTGSTGNTALDAILVEKDKLRYMTSRRIAPVAMNDKLFVSILNVQGGSNEPHTYKLHRFDLLATGVTELTSSVGRSFMTKSAERDNGIFEGSVIAWDSETKVLANVTGDILDLGSPEGVIAAEGDTSAITSVFGRTSGVPLAGIGNLVALRGMPNGGHNWHLMASDADAPGGLVHVDQVPTSSWIYE